MDLWQPASTAKAKDSPFWQFSNSISFLKANQKEKIYIYNETLNFIFVVS